jgi:hypothetical protein
VIAWGGDQPDQNAMHPGAARFLNAHGSKYRRAKNLRESGFDLTHHHSKTANPSQTLGIL